MSTSTKNKLKEAVITGDIETIIDHASELKKLSTDSVSSVLLAMAMIECIMTKHRNSWLDEAIVGLQHIHSYVPNARESMNKLYLEVLVNIKIKAAMHRLLSLDPNECDASDMNSIILKYFDPSSFSHIEEQLFQPEKMEYVDKDSYAAMLHKTAFDGINGLIKSREEVEQMRDIFDNDLNRIEMKLMNCLRKYFQYVKKKFSKIVDPAKEGGNKTNDMDSSTCISDTSSSHLEPSSQTSSLKLRENMPTSLLNCEPQVDVDSFDASQTQFNLDLPDGMLQAPASQLQFCSDHSNTQPDKPKPTFTNQTIVPKFFYEEDSQSEASSSFKSRTSVSKNTARKRTQPYNLRQVSHPSRVSLLEPKKDVLKQAQAVASLKKTRNEQLNPVLAENDGEKELFVSSSLKEAIRSTNDDTELEIDICAIPQYDANLTQIIDVEGTQEDSFSTQMLDVEDFTRERAKTQGTTKDTQPTERCKSEVTQFNVTQVQATMMEGRNTLKTKKGKSSSLEAVRKDIVMMAKKKKKSNRAHS